VNKRARITSSLLMSADPGGYAWVCGRSLADIAGSNLAGGTSVSLL